MCAGAVGYFEVHGCVLLLLETNDCPKCVATAIKSFTGSATSLLLP